MSVASGLSKGERKPSAEPNAGLGNVDAGRNELTVEFGRDMEQFPHDLFSDPSRDDTRDSSPIRGTAVHDLELGANDEIRIDSRRSRDRTDISGRSLNVYPNTLKSDAKIDVNKLPRLVLRDRAFHQSSNKVHIIHNQGARIFKLLKHNWFFVFLRMPTTKSLLLLMSVWTGAILLFAWLYVLYDAAQGKGTCGLGLTEGDPIYFAAAFSFSLETCTTVGYGLPNGVNAFFERGCGGLQFIIYLQMAWSMLFNAFLLTFLYNRLGRSETRSTQVIYSDKALVSIVDGQVRFQVRIFDCDAKHPVVEAHVRLYCVMKRRPVPRPLRLLQPDDDLGGMLFLSFPSVVNHNIDLYSLLHPPTATMSMIPHGLVLRQVDGSTAGRDDVVCPICGKSYGSYERWKSHVQYQTIVETQDDYPVAGTHRSIDLSEFDSQPGIHPTRDLDLLEDYFKNNVSEILCLVEGIDPMQSGTFQALQSYRYEDIVWEQHSQFAPCLTVVNKASRREKIYCVDLERYHDIVTDPEAEAAALEAAAEAAEMAKLEYALQPTTTATTPKKDNSSAQPRKRHRRIKTLSSRTSDSLFTSDQNPNGNAATKTPPPEPVFPLETV